EANAFYAKTKPLYRNETIVAAMKANPEEVVSKAFRPGNVTGVRTLKEILPKKDFEEAQDLFINKVLEVDKMGNFDPKDLSQKISGYGKEFIY
ncbi:hypothetical protein LRR18_18735, partial [Mangrovimonas sp. AS39]|uniref:hypothetical protein n=1 Tax=Mangrovimonas futianensis TaxID=2895523 RepID=UPI001E44BEEE